MHHPLQIPRRGRRLGEVCELMQRRDQSIDLSDAIAIFGAGIAAMHWDPSAVDWRLNSLVVLLGAVLGVRRVGARDLAPVGHRVHEDARRRAAVASDRSRTRP